MASLTLFSCGFNERMRKLAKIKFLSILLLMIRIWIINVPTIRHITLVKIANFSDLHTLRNLPIMSKNSIFFFKKKNWKLKIEALFLARNFKPLICQIFIKMDCWVKIGVLSQCVPVQIPFRAKKFFMSEKLLLFPTV